MSNRIYLGSLQYSTKKQKELTRLLRYDKEVRKEVNRYIERAIRPYVPTSTPGNDGRGLRHAIVTERGIIWGKGLPYARYQFEGDVYGPNIPFPKSGNITYWKSRKGVRKHRLGRKLGEHTDISYRGWVFGYKDPLATYHWTEKYTKPYSALRRETNILITRYLKNVCKSRGLNV